MLIKFALSLSYLMLTGVSLWMLRPFRNASPFFWFIIAQAGMAIGSFAISDFDNPSHVLYAALFFLALITFVASVMLYLQRMDVIVALAEFERRPETDEHQDVKLLTGVMLVLCLIITVVYYRAVGYNIILQLLVGGGVEDYSTARLEAYSGENYFAPGYVNQFKNNLLPVCAAAVGVWLWRGKKRLPFYLYCAVIIPSVFLALAGTGQRGYLFYTAVAFFCAYVLHSTGRKGISMRKVALYASPVVIAFMLMTAVYYGRASEGALVVVRDTIMRFTTIQQESGLVGFDYVMTLPIQWFTDWAKSLIGILPGYEGSMISHDVHAIMYGTYRGTAPLNSIGSAYYNGGVAGVLVLFGLMGFFYALAYRAYLKGPRTVIRSLSYGMMFLYMAAYLVETPVFLIDNGILAVAVFLVLVKAMEMRGRNAGAPAADPAYR